MKAFKKYTTSGFTLIELLITIAIIVVLGAIAIPSYSTYTIKSKLTEVILRNSSVKARVATYIQTNGGSLPACDTAPSFDPGLVASNTTYAQGPYWSHNCAVETYIYLGAAGIKNIAGFASIILKPTVQSDGSIQWNCGYYDSTGGTNLLPYLPTNCQRPFSALP
jgi:prepilin-type N-terminal cleavage/methylation domain-containing protein